MYDKSYRRSNIRYEKGPGWLSRAWTLFKNGCLLLIILALLSPICFALLLFTYGIPGLEASQLENLPKSMDDATRYIQEMNQPVPNDVVLTPAIMDRARAKGFYEEFFDNYYQVQSCIAAADRMGIDRSHLCAIMDYEGGWPSTIEANTFIIALQKALGLRELGYDPQDTKIEVGYVNSEGVECEALETCVEPTRACLNDTCEAILSYFGDDFQTLEIIIELSEYWSVTSQARIRNLPPWAWVFWPGIVVEFWTYYNLGYGDLMALYGGPGGISDLPGLPGIPPNVPDDVFVNPYPGSGICGYHFGQPVGSYFHWGIDLCKPGQDWIVAGHNCTITWVGNIPRASRRAVEWWVSGETVACQSTLADGTTIWTVYGHGEPGTYQVSPGNTVRAGQALMLADSTGFSTGNHLHYGMKINDQWVNPTETLN